MDDEIWTVARILNWIEGYLAQHGDENPRVSAQWLVSEALDCSRMQLFLDAERPLSVEERAVLRDWTRRRGSGEPLQYITGDVAFRHITVKVRRDVLIPRPETEVLVSEALSLIPPPAKPQVALDDELIRQFVELGGQLEDHDAGVEGRERPCLLVADICTGSGCIACSIAYEHSATHVIATDISSEAVELARENVNALGLDAAVEVLECDLGEGVDPALLGTFDLIVSNPPYVPTSELGELPREVGEHEPALALDGGADGLVFFRRLLEWCATALKPGGSFAFELHETRLDSAASEAIAAGFEDVSVRRDLADKPRVLIGRKKRA